MDDRSTRLRPNQALLDPAGQMTGASASDAERADAAEAALQQCEERLRAREAEFRLLTDHIPVALARCDAEGRFVFVNRAYAQRFGFMPGEVIGKRIPEIVGDTAYASFCEHIDAVTSGQLREWEGLVPFASGARIMHAMYTPDAALDNPDGKVGFVAVIQDVTERHTADAALRASEERLRLATEAAGLGIWIWYLADDRVEWENERPYEIFGIPLTETPVNATRFLADYLHPDDAAEFHRAVAHTLETNAAFYFRGRIRGDGGVLHWLELTGSLHVSPDGTPFRMIGTAQNVTDRLRGEEQVRGAAEANAKFRTMFTQGMQFAGILSIDGTVVEANRLCVEGCGFTRDEIIGRPFWECGWWNRSPALMQMVKSGTREAAQGRLVRTESSYFIADGSERCVDLILAPVTDDDGKVLFVAPTGNDITDKKRAESELRDADRRKDEFLATLAHELRNPLAPIRTGLEVIKRAPLDSPAVSKARDVMERQLGHMVRLIDDLLDLSRIARGKVELRKQRVELRVAIESALETSAPAMAAGHHELRVTLPEAPLWIDADLTRIAQALGNILGNAAKYTADGGHISVSARQHDRMVIIEIADTGVGIPPAMLEQVFDMFAQVNKSDSGRSQGGLGIGLAIVKLLIEMHGGSVAAASAGVGHGSTFTVRLPIAASATNQEPVADRRGAIAAQERNARRVLIVDDNVDGADLLAMMLDLAGYETRTAYDGPAALSAARAFAPEVVFLDIGMPGMDGHEVAKRMREDTALAGAKLVALTGWGSQEDKRRSQEAGFDFHLTKPVEILALNAVLDQCSTAHVAKPAGD
jgi:PAS domain S-box-containing protein